MKRWTIFTIVALAVSGAAVLSERRKAEAPVSSDPLVYFVADTEHELSRLPVAMTRFSDSEEIEIGDELARSYDSMLRTEGEEEKSRTLVVGKYVSRVGSQVSGYAHRKLPYRFHYIPSPNFINAFALPGGHVFIGGGMLALMDSEDQLACVLGHEIEHIDHYHCAERVQLEMRVRKIPLGGLVALPAEIFMAGYSKDQELEADREGAKLAVWAGYSPLGALRMFETFERLYSEQVSRARTPQEELSQVAEQTIRDYFRTHPATSDRIKQIRQMIADEHWETRTRERDLKVSSYFLTQLARQACGTGKYERCEGLAKRSLTIDPDQRPALETLARAQFMLADFTGAAGSLRKYLDAYGFDQKHPETYAHDVNLLGKYAEALAAEGNPVKSAAEFKSWAGARLGASLPDAARADIAGLDLLAGNEAPAKEATQPDSPALQVGRVGWWYYRAGRYDNAVKLLLRAVEQRPGVHEMSGKLGWALIEQKNYQSALQRLEQALGNRATTPPVPSPRDAGDSFEDASMGIAVARWQANQKDMALKWYSSVSVDQSQWLNPRWVRALYSPLVAKSISEMQAEYAKSHSGQGPRASQNLTSPPLSP